uniref:Membrane protein BRI3 n=1 Tax=Crocodylus porosus TaxID=8502 RepID=A0A7M4FTT9_CROPO
AGSCDQPRAAAAAASTTLPPRRAGVALLHAPPAAGGRALSGAGLVPAWTTSRCCRTGPPPTARPRTTTGRATTAPSPARSPASSRRRPTPTPRQPPPSYYLLLVCLCSCKCTRVGSSAGYGVPPGPPQHNCPNTYTIIQQPTTTTSVVVVGGCPACRVGVLEDTFTCLGVFCAIVFFPIGILFCLALRQRRCPNCGAAFG